MAAIAKEKNGQIQITLTLPTTEVKKAREKVEAELIKNVAVAGFRKGKAPRQKALAKIDEEEIIRHILNQLLPEHFSRAVKEYKIKPAIYPRFEIINTSENKDWQIRAVTCEIPQINLGDYKKSLPEALKEAKKDAKEPTREEKEQKALYFLLQSIKVELPEFLIEEEVSHRLIHLVEKLEKLGVSLDKYLESVGKTSERLREDYKKQAEDAIKMELILSKIAEEEKVSIEDKDITATINAADLSDNEEQRNAVRTVLRKRAALDSLVALM